MHEIIFWWNVKTLHTCDNSSNNTHYGINLYQCHMILTGMIERTQNMCINQGNYVLLMHSFATINACYLAPFKECAKL